MKKRNKFSLSHYRLFSAKMGYIVPIGLMEVLPGDTFQHSTSLFLRVSPLVTPVMHPVHVIIHHWYIPLRLLWDGFEDFITGGPDGMDTSTIPWANSAMPGTPNTGVEVGSLADYLGVPTGFPGIGFSILPFRAYALLYNECYRDQDLEEEVGFTTESSSNDQTTNRNLLRCDWARDYFTTARPWPQKGPQVTVPVNPSGEGVTGQAAITGNPVLGVAQPGSIPGSSRAGWIQAGDNDAYYWGYRGRTQPDGPAGLKVGAGDLAVSLNIDNPEAGVGVVNINDLREAFALQRFEEHRALYGSRYVEYLRYLGVRSSDARLQRPEYLGGSKQTIQFSEVLQTAPGDDLPVGTLRGHGIGVSRSRRYRRFFEEHGYIMSVMMVRPISVYMQGLNRLWSRQVKEDFFQKELQHIGQQEVLTSELYAGATRDKVFGYQNRYDEYRSMQSYVSGEFRTILNSWHMAREFANAPTLNADFINALPTTRVFAAQDNDTLYCMANHSVQARRILSKYGNPI